MACGKVFLVGAGPGDPGLITCRGWECLARADIVVYDYLVDPRLLAVAPAGAEKIYVGKSGARHTREQPDINQLLVDKARTGKTVVRLKGGDPFVFGRGGEEGETLAAQSIVFEVVPGISSAIAVPAYAGIPVTHRAMASSFAVITGHEDARKRDSSIDWSQVATAADTLVFLMGMQNIAEIAARLIANGRKPSTPVAVIKSGTLPEQTTVTGTLKNIALRVQKAGLGPPAVIVVGNVVRLREKLAWFDNRPLFGKTVLVTRSRQQASALCRLLADYGARTVEMPAIDVRPIAETVALDAAIRGLDNYNWVVFTSTNGVAAFYERLAALRLDSRALHGRRIAVIGPATAQALAQRGITADYCPAVYTGAALVAGFAAWNIRGQRFLLPRADIADKELTEGLKQRGALVHEVSAYRTVQPEAVVNLAKLLVDEKIDVITFASSSTVTNLVSALDGDGTIPPNVKIACIGPKTAATAIAAGLKVDIMAKEQTIPGLVAAIEEYFQPKRNII